MLITNNAFSLSNNETLIVLLCPLYIHVHVHITEESLTIFQSSSFEATVFSKTAAQIHTRLLYPWPYSKCLIYSETCISRAEVRCLLAMTGCCLVNQRLAGKPRISPKSHPVHCQKMWLQSRCQAHPHLPIRDAADVGRGVSVASSPEVNGAWGLIQAAGSSPNHWFQSLPAPDPVSLLGGSGL